MIARPRFLGSQNRQTKHKNRDPVRNCEKVKPIAKRRKIKSMEEILDKINDKCKRKKNNTRKVTHWTAQDGEKERDRERQEAE